MISDPRFWADDFRRVQRERIRTFREVVESRMLTAFDNLEREANDLEDSEIRRLSALESVAEDPTAVAEIAFENSANWYVTMTSLRQGVTNLLAAALSHVIEQILLEFYALEFVQVRPIQWQRKLVIVLNRLKDEGVDCDAFVSWPKLQELGKVAGVVKHGEGHSADALRQLRPDLFVHPRERKRTTSPYNSLHLEIPALGEGIYVTRDDLKEYFDAAERFCEEIATSLERIR